MQVGNHVHDCVVVGGGAAGLTAAQHLVKNGISDVVLLEALDKLGGRIQLNTTFLPNRPIALGAEYIHSASPLYELFVERGCVLRQRFTCSMGDGPWPDEPVGDGGVGFVYLGENKQVLNYDTTDEDFTKVKTMLRQIYEGEVQIEGNPSVMEFFRSRGFTDQMISIAEAGFGNTACAPLEKLSILETAELLQIWESTEGDDYVPDDSLYQLVRWFSEGLPDVRLNWKVEEINYEDEYVVIRRDNGDTIRAKHVVITVPVSILKLGIIEFVPDLPPEKQEAIKAIEMFPACKIVLRFTKRFWPENVHGGICSGCIIPELWMDTPQRVGHVVTPASSSSSSALTVSPRKGSEDKDQHSPSPSPAGNEQNDVGSFIVVGFATAKFAEAISAMSEEEAATKFLAQLDEIFGTAEDPTPASSCNDGFLVHDWAKVPTIRGGYSTTSAGASSHTRADLARSVDNKLFFAGEACNSDSMSVHSALATGLKAANDIIALLG